MIKCPDKMNQALHNITETLKEFSTALIEAGCCAIMFDTLDPLQDNLKPEDVG